MGADVGSVFSGRKNQSSSHYECVFADLGVRETTNQSSQPNSPSIIPPALSWQKRPILQDLNQPKNPQAPQANTQNIGESQPCENYSPDHVFNDESHDDLAINESINFTAPISQLNNHEDVLKNGSKRDIVSLGTDSPVLLPPTPNFSQTYNLKPECRDSAIYSTSNHLSTDKLDRPSSPTKGFGGFVQSAMMRRNNSVNKRWVAHKSMSMKRGEPMSINALSNSVGSQNSTDPEIFTHTRSRSNSNQTRINAVPDRPLSSISLRDNMSLSRDSSHTHPVISTPRSRTALGVRAGSVSASELGDQQETPPDSPTKTLDRRRWSPTKSSWLEAALNKPESFKPKTKAMPPSQQPTWMAELNKAKQRLSVDISHTPSVGLKHEVSIGGLMRSSVACAQIPVGPQSSCSPIVNSSTSSSGPAVGTNSNPSRHVPTPDRLNTSCTPANSNRSASPLFSTSSLNREEEKTPLKNFRANLKPRRLSPDINHSSELELKSLLGQLRPTKTQNYVAADELKDNITRGRAALHLTNGPQKSEIKDEFKEAILQRKENFRKTQLEGRGVNKTPNENLEPELPEALIKQRTLRRSESVSSPSTINVDLASHHRLIRHPRAQSSSCHKYSPKTEIGRIPEKANPAIEKFLIRGSLSEYTNSNLNSSSAILKHRDVSPTQFCQSSPQLTHLTRDRARGPKRRAPTKTLSLDSSRSPFKNKEISLDEEISTKIQTLPFDTSNFKSSTPRSIIQAADIEVSTFQPLMPSTHNVPPLVSKTDRFEMSLQSTPKTPSTVPKAVK